MRLINRTLLLIILLFTFCTRTPELFPEYFYELNLTKKLTGDEAKNFVNRLHFNSVTNEKNEIGFYNGLKGNAVIYVTYYDNDNSALINYDKMTKKISPENSVFTNSSYINILGRNIYKTYGMGQTHFVFTVENKLFWISAGMELPQNFLIEYLKRFD
ncbi:MAG: hypothetical protein AB1432_08625 [Bacteroidota bacterium]